jgi:hypothetical protein
MIAEADHLTLKIPSPCTIATSQFAPIIQPSQSADILTSGVRKN